MHYRCDTYLTSGGSVAELTWLASSFGYDNPGPIVAFPGNSNVFNAPATPGALPPGVVVQVPWHPSVLRRLMAAQIDLAQSTIDDMNKEMATEGERKKGLESLLGRIDAMALIGSLWASAATAAGQASKGITAASMVTWLVETRLATAGAIATMAIPPLDEPKQELSFFVRHALGAWTPSFWASVYAAVKTGNVDLYLYGAAGVEHANKMNIHRNAELNVAKALKVAETIQAQLDAPFYRWRA